MFLPEHYEHTNQTTDQTNFHEFTGHQDATSVVYNSTVNNYISKTGSVQVGSKNSTFLSVADSALCCTENLNEVIITDGTSILSEERSEVS